MPMEYKFLGAKWTVEILSHYAIAFAGDSIYSRPGTGSPLAKRTL